MRYTFDIPYRFNRYGIIIDLAIGQELFPMLLVSGTQKTLLPMKWREGLGHNEHGIGECCISGVGGVNCQCRLHTSVFSFRDKFGKVWSSPANTEFAFTKGLDEFPFGLLGTEFMYGLWGVHSIRTVNYRPEGWTLSFEPKKDFSPSQKNSLLIKELEAEIRRYERKIASLYKTGA